jgi:hypothetical protein
MIIAADTATSTTMNCGTLVYAMVPSSPITAPMTGAITIPRKLASGPVGRVNRKKESAASDGRSKPRRRSSPTTKASTAVRMRTTATKAANHPSNAPEDAPRLLVVSAGSDEANREMGLASPVLLDQQFATGRAFGASGPPSAVLVNSENKIASEVAVGAPAVLELAGADQTAA